MKAILEFNLPEEQYNFDCANNGFAWRSACEDIIATVREKVKYGHSYVSADDALSDVYDELFRVLDDRGLKID